MIFFWRQQIKNEFVFSKFIENLRLNEKKFLFQYIDMD